MSDELKVHRRVQRLRARFSPTAIYTPFLPTDQPTSTPAANPSPASAPASTPDAAPATSNPPSAPAAPATSSTPAAADATSSAPAAATPSAPSSVDPAAASTPSVTPTSALSTPATPSQPTASVPSNTSSSIPDPSQPAPSQAQGAPAQQSASTPTTPDKALTPSASGGHSVTNTILQLPASGSASPSASGTPTASSGVNVPVVIGVVVAVIVGLAGIIFAVTFFMRRSRKDKDIDEDAFSADAFRRQSTALVDPPPSHSPPSRGFTPRPPSMIEQRLAQGPPISFSQHPYGNNNGYYAYPDQASYAPGQYITMPGESMPPQAWTPDSSRPFFSPMGETPLGSPVSVAPYDSAYDAHGQLIRQPSPGPAEYLNRQPSMGAASQLSRQPSAGPGQFLTRQTPDSGMSLDVPNGAHYVDLSRSSVSPFQAEQYAEISQKLNTEPPMPLPSPLVAAAADEAITRDDDDDISPDVTEPRPLKVVNQSSKSPHSSVNGSPFADPQMQGYDMPKPPSPTFSNKSRIDSTPPTLPEMQRAFSPVSLEFPMNASPAARAAPSPLAGSVEMPSPPAEVHSTHNAPHDSAPPTPRPARDEMPPARPDTVYTMYDDDDAYGGI